MNPQKIYLTPNNSFYHCPECKIENNIPLIKFNQNTENEYSLISECSNGHKLFIKEDNFTEQLEQFTKKNLSNIKCSKCNNYSDYFIISKNYIFVC